MGSKYPGVNVKSSFWEFKFRHLKPGLNDATTGVRGKGARGRWSAKCLGPGLSASAWLGLHGRAVNRSVLLTCLSCTWCSNFNCRKEARGLWISARVLHVFGGSICRKTGKEPWGQAQARHLPSLGIPVCSRVQLRTLEVSGRLPQKRKRGQG